MALRLSGFGSVEHRPVWQHRPTAEVSAADGRLQERFPARFIEHVQSEHGTREGRTAAAAARAAGRIWTGSLTQNGLR